MLLTMEQVYKIAGTESELPSHIKSQKLQYFSHIGLSHDNMEATIKGTCGRSEKS